MLLGGLWLLVLVLVVVVVVVVPSCRYSHQHWLARPISSQAAATESLAEEAIDNGSGLRDGTHHVVPSET